MRHRDIVGAVQSDRKGLGTYNFKPFCKSSTKDRRDAVVNEAKRVERERRYVHLVQCSRQGRCLRWEEPVIERQLSRKELWAWEPARLSFLVKYDTLPSAANLVRWKVSEESKCQCGQCGTFRHILSACPMGLKDRYTWRHNQVLRIIVEAIEMKPSPDVGVWSDDARQEILLELTVSWQENFGDAEDRKYRRYKELIDTCKEAGWNPDYYHLAVGCRGYVSRELANLMHGRFRFTTREQRTGSRESLILHLVET
ncbi:hypothetical protein ACROYT_G040458 [Oculina patagonica]